MDVFSALGQTCFRLDALLSSSRYQDALASLACQQACCKLIVKNFHPQAWCKLFQQLAASLQISSCNKSDFHRLATTWWSQQTCCNLLTTCNKSVAFLHVYSSELEWTIYLSYWQIRVEIFWRTEHFFCGGGGGLKRLIWSYGTPLHLSSGNPSMSVTS